MLCPASLASVAVTGTPHPAMIAPFVVMLLCIALMPFIQAHWWERHYPKVALGLSAISVGYYLIFLYQPLRLWHVALDYFSFISLIGSLFVVAGGILIRVKGQSTPMKNCVFLAAGSILANLVGTTGASMLLIRPWIHANRYRVTGYHVVFFIFVISNVAGSLTPIGDPPLFLGYLKKIPFFWTLTHLWPAWLMAVGALIAVFYVIDSRNFRRAPSDVREKETGGEEWQFGGWINLLFLAAILGAVFLSTPWREFIMLGAAAGSYYGTPAAIHQSNAFHFRPIKEVAWLFLGIFATMIPALDYLASHAEAFGIDRPIEFYWWAGILSSFLDNAPTYLTFLTTSVALHHAADGHLLDVNSASDVAIYLQGFPLELVAISLGAVFFGACTYIGNGPNFMVKSIAEHSKVHCPSFFGYIWRYALPVLIPIYALIGWIFLRG